MGAETARSSADIGDDKGLRDTALGVLLVRADGRDEAALRGALASVEAWPCALTIEPTCVGALRRLNAERVDVVFVALPTDQAPDETAALAALTSRAPCVALIDEALVDHARRAVREGMWDFALRGEAEDLRAVASRALAYGALRARAQPVDARAALLDRLVRADAEATFGTFSASVSHGINSQLMEALAGVGIIRHIARTMLNAIESSSVDADALRVTLEAVLDAAARVRDGIDGAASVARGVSAFGIQGTQARDSVDISHVLDAVRAVSDTVARHRARLVVDAGALPQVQGGASHVGHQVLSAVLDAVTAIPDGEPESHTVTLRATRRDDVVVVEVEHATAPSGAEPAPTNTVATLTFRVVGASPPRRPTPHQPLPAAGGARRRGRVLVLDDEPMLLELMARILRIDHEVVATTTPAEALARIEAGEGFDVFLCDMMMPAMSGEKVYRRVLTVAPDLAQRVIFLTAGAFSASARDFLQGAPVVWFEKPIDPEQLRAIIAARVQSR